MSIPAPGSPIGALRVATAGTRSHLSRLARSGRAWLIAPRLYVVGATLPREELARRHVLGVIGHVWPGAVLCDRSGWAGPVPVDGWLFLCHPDPPRRSDLRLPGLTLSPRVGPGHLPGDIAFPDVDAHQAGLARALIENVTLAGRPPSGRPARQAGTAAVEDRIDELIRISGEGRIRLALAQVDTIADHLPARSVAAVRQRLAAVLGTRTGPAPPSVRLAARLAGTPFDAHRLNLLSTLITELERCAPLPRPDLEQRASWRPFFEAYFSNYIEGTEFGVEEARRIVVDGHVPAARPKDAHDVAATHRLIVDPVASNETPATPGDLLDITRARHAVLMAARPETRPGAFKDRPNFVGSYRFVEPDLVEGTLRHGFTRLDRLTDPMHRAIAVMFLLTDCHPFVDGNGRVARLLANAELSRAGQIRVIIPTVFRNNYLAALSGTSRGMGRGQTLISVVEYAQRWTAATDWSSYDSAVAQLERSHAFVDPSLAEASGQRLRLP